VFVPLAAPGDRVRAEVVTAKPRWARARMVELLESAPDRRAAPCPVFGECGGCRLQHLPWKRQAAAKRNIVAAALRRIGGLDVEVAETICAGEPLGYRNRVTLTVRPARLDLDGEVPARAGFHGLHRPAAVIDCPNCLLAEPAVWDAWEALAPWDCLPEAVGEKAELRVTIRAAVDGRIALLVEGGTGAGNRDELCERLPGLESYLWIDDEGVRCQLAGRATFAEEWQGVRFRLDPTVFLQVNRAAAAAMDDWIDARIEAEFDLATRREGRREDMESLGKDLMGGLRVADLYAGVGARAIRWARDGAEVSTCEIDRYACEASRAAARKQAGRVDVRRGRVEDHLELTEADLVVVNPPRAGLSGEVREALAAGPARAVAYVSCDPATLARDLERITDAYDVVAVQPFDAFPQTAHVEAIAWLRRRADATPADPETAGLDGADAETA
ncbi:MAG: class I SAM-dependent RNA methyltransferase, partial [Gemmatimonadota bacterium]